MLGSVRSWWGTGGRRGECDELESQDKLAETNVSEVDDTTKAKTPQEEPNEETEVTSPNPDDDLKKALSTAKEWGSYFYSMGKAATVAATKAAAAGVKSSAQTLKEQTAVATPATDQVPLLGAFSREQNEFVREKREKSQRREAAVPPWVGYNEEETMKQQILALSQESRNFLRNPPAGADFHFDPDVLYPVAMATLAEDPSLQKMRFQLVPQQIKEERFWRNYFYRVSLIKQSAQLTTLAQTSDTPTTTTDRSSKTSSEASSTAESYDRLSDVSETSLQRAAISAPPGGAPGGSLSALHERQVSESEDFVSDNPESSALSPEERKALGTGDPAGGAGEEEVDEWEAELQRELIEYELVQGESPGVSASASESAAKSGVDDEELEREIMAQLEAEGAA